MSSAPQTDEKTLDEQNAARQLRWQKFRTSLKLSLLVTGVVMLVPSLRWGVVGWVRWESSYQRWPTSY